MAEAVKFEGFAKLTAAWGHSVPAERLRQLRRAAEPVRDALLTEGPVAALSSVKLVTFPYPTVHAFSGGAKIPAPYVMMTNRMQVVQYKDHEGALRTLLFNPTDYERGQKAPFYWDLRQRYGNFVSDRLMSHKHVDPREHLAAIGVRAEDVDFIAFDHLHIQDVRGWLGANGERGYFPKAKLLVMRKEWEAASDLHPMQHVWYVGGMTAGIPADRLVFLEGDAHLGRGVAILATPGHTFGNMSLAVVTERGLFVVSENGVATESYSPLQSKILGLKGYAEQYGHEVILNGNTREGSLDQYSSMVLEKLIAGPSRENPGYVNFLPSSELTASAIAPGLAPTFSHSDISFGTIRR